MRLRSKVIVATLVLTFLLTAILSLVFLSELLRERVAQTDAANDTLVHQILSSARSALQSGIRQNPPTEPGIDAFNQAVRNALTHDDALRETLDGIVRYSSAIQDAYITDASGTVLIGTDPSMVNLHEPRRRSFHELSARSLLAKRRLLFGTPEALDVNLPLQRNGQPFLTAHLGVRSTLLRNTYAPWLRDAAIVCIFALAGSVLVALIVSAAALRPIERISRELDVIPVTGPDVNSPALTSDDAVERVSSKISRLDQQIRTSEQTRTEMATNLNSMLQTLKDGVMLFTAELRVAMASDAVVNFLPEGQTAAPGTPLFEVFPPSTQIGAVLAGLVAKHSTVRDRQLLLEDGRIVALSLDYFPGSGLGALLTIHDVGAQEEVEREIEVSRRLASIGRLTAGVGHEVKNPINAMVVHLELLRGKLANGPEGAQRHVDVLASEMGRLDRVVQTLADFSRPMEPQLREQDLSPIINAVVQLVTAEAEMHDVSIAITEDYPGRPLPIVGDSELLRQALLNIVLNAMQAMPSGGIVHIHTARDRSSVVLSLRDTGTGIPPEKIDRIFDLYFTTKPTGSGIGLAMTYRIIQMHGGIIDVTSDADPASPNRGTIFTVRLPLASRSPQFTPPAAVSA